MGYDGWVTVVTKLDTKQLEKDLKKLEKELQKYEKEAERLTKRKLKLEIDNEKTLNDLTKVDNKIEIIDKKIKEMERVNLPENLSENIDYQKLLNQREELNNKGEEYLAKLERIKAEQTEINIKILENSTNQELVTQKIAETRRKLGGIDVDFSKIGKSINGVIKKVSRWALAVFGIRGAYMAVRNAINVISRGDEQLASDIEYMKTALVYTIEPIVRGIVNLMKQLMYYVAYIVKAWTGRDIFASANKSLSGANKNAQKLSKTLAGFDEMNVLSDNSSSSSTANSSFDLATPEDAEVPSWIKWIAENKEIIIGALAGLALGLLAIKAADPTTWITLAIAALATLVAVIIANWDKIKETLSKVANWIYDNIIKPIGNFFVELWNGIKEIFNPIIDFFKSIFSTIYENIKISINNIKEIFVFLWDKIKEIFGPFATFIKDVFKEAINSLKPFIDAVLGLWDKVKNSLKKFGTKVGEVIGSAFKTAINGVLKAIENILNTPIKAINGLISVINKVPGIELTKLQTFNLPRLAVGGIVNMPGRGIMYGGANIGERGAEGVIPLTNTQMMTQLGEAIGRYININATVPVYVGNRQIAREIKKINTESDFATNS